MLPAQSVVRAVRGGALGPRVRPALGWAVRRLRELADPWMSRCGIEQPVPPRRLRARTGAPGVREFVDGGRTAAAELEAVLAAAGLPSAGPVLDFGCGSGRVLPHMPGVHRTGCDVDAEAIAWAARAHPALSWRVSGFAPPLPFPNGAFRLVYSISVFSHLSEPLQDRWLAELQRVLAPGGVALLTVHGPSAFDQFVTGAVRTGWTPPDAFARGPLRPDEFVFVPYGRSVWNAGQLPGVSPEYGLTFHGHRYVEHCFSRCFDVVTIAPRAVADWQDVVVCRRRD